MRPGVLVLCTFAVGCSGRSLPAPVVEAAAAAASTTAGPDPAPPFAPTAVVQTLPYPGWMVWSSHGETLGIVARGECETTLFDAASGLAKARLHACAPSADPRGDGFLLRDKAGRVDLWSPRGSTQSAVVPADSTDWMPIWSPDGAHLAALTSDSVVLLDPDTGRTARTIHVDGAVSLRWIGMEGDRVVWSADGAHVVVGDSRRAWIVGVGADTTQTLLECLPVRAQFAPRGDTLAFDCGGNSGGRVWDAAGHQLVTRIPHLWRWSSTGRYVLAFDSTAVEVRDAATGQLTMRAGGVASVGTFAFSPDDRWLAIHSWDAAAHPQVAVWDVAAGTKVASRAGLMTPRWSADAAFLSAEEPGDVPRMVVLDAGTWSEHWWREGSSNEAAWAPVGARLALGSSTYGVDVVDLHAGTSQPVGGAEETRFTRIEVAPDGAVVAHLEERARRDAASCQALRLDTAGRTTVIPVSCDAGSGDLPSPDGAKTTRTSSRASRRAMLMAPSTDLYVEDTASRDRWFVDAGWMRSAAWSTRGHRLLVAGARPVLYEADTHRVWGLHESGVAWALDAEGKRVAVAQQDGTVHVVTVGSREAPLVLPAATDRATHLALSGERLAAVTQNGAVTVWDVGSHGIVATWETGLTPLQVAWGGDGAFLVMATADEVRLSRPDGTRAIDLTGLRTVGATTWLARDGDGLVDGPRAALAAIRWRLTDDTQARLDAAGVERATHKSPIRSGMIEALARGEDP